MFDGIQIRLVAVALIEAVTAIGLYILVAHLVKSVWKSFRRKRAKIKREPLQGSLRERLAQFRIERAEDLNLFSDALRTETRRFIEGILVRARDWLQDMINKSQRRGNLWTKDPAFAREDFEQALAAWRAWKMPEDLTARAAEIPPDEDPREREFTSFLIEWFFSKYGANEAWDYIYRFRFVMDFLAEHRSLLSSTPEEIVRLCDCKICMQHLEFNPAFLDFVLGGFEDALWCGHHPTHPLMGQNGLFIYERTLDAFRDWLEDQSKREEERKSKAERLE